MQDARKLRRGLKDISPLFTSKREIAAPVFHVRCVPPVEDPSEPESLVHPGFDQEGHLEILSVFCPNMTGDSLLLNTYVASRLASAMCPCTVISIQSNYLKSADGKAKFLPNESFVGPLKQVSLAWGQFEAIISRPLHLNPGQYPASQMLFLDFEHQQIPRLEKVVSILDKWIIVVEPTVESLGEAYKMMKVTKSLNNRLEYFLLLDGKIAGATGGLLFERFQEMVAGRLGINLVWLGCFHLSPDDSNRKTVPMPLVLEHLFLNSQPKVCSSASLALAAYAQSFTELTVTHG